MDKVVQKRKCLENVQYSPCDSIKVISIIFQVGDQALVEKVRHNVREKVNYINEPDIQFCQT